MRVVFLEASSGSVVGGSLTGMLELLRGLDRSRIVPSVVLYEDKPCIPALEADGIPVSVVRSRRLSKEHALQATGAWKQAKKAGFVTTAMKWARATGTLLLETLPAALRLKAVLAPLRPDLVYVCNGFRGNADAILASRLLGVPCLVHAKGFDKWSWVERLLSRGVAGCVCMTKAIEDHCRRGGMQPAFFRVIYDGLDLEAFRPRRDPAETRRALGLDAEAEVVGVVGNIQEWKGQGVLLQALGLLASRRPRLKALVVGGVHRSGAAYAESLHAFVREQGLADRVVWTGARSDVPDLIAAMDVFVHTSVRGEPFGRVIVEAMAVGRPVLATKAGGVPEFVHDGQDGLLLPPGDAEALAECLDRLLDDPVERGRLAAGALQAAQRFALQQHADAMMVAFDMATGESCA